MAWGRQQQHTLLSTSTGAAEANVASAASIKVEVSFMAARLQREILGL